MVEMSTPLPVTRTPTTSRVASKRMSAHLVVITLDAYMD